MQVRSFTTTLFHAVCLSVAAVNSAESEPRKERKEATGSMVASRSFLAEIVGEEALKGKRCVVASECVVSPLILVLWHVELSLSLYCLNMKNASRCAAWYGLRGCASVLLVTMHVAALVDSLAGRVAVRYSRGPVATVCFDRVDITRPVLHGVCEGSVALVSDAANSLGTGPSAARRSSGERGQILHANRSARVCSGLSSLARVLNRCCERCLVFVVRIYCSGSTFRRRFACMYAL